MPRRAAIGALDAALAAASAARNFADLERAVTALGPAMQDLAAQGDFSPAERSALARLRRTHEQAMQACAAEQEWLANRLQELQNNKAGWLAYALDKETEMSQDQA